MKKILFLITTLIICQTIFASTFLLKPTGQYEVGFHDFRLVNGTLQNGHYSCSGKTDLLYEKGKNEKDFGLDNQKYFCREVMLRIYYPVIKQYQPSYAQYYEPAISDLQNQIIAAHVPGMTQEDLNELGKIKTFTVKDAPVADQQFPVLLFAPGAGVEVQSYENMISEIVSQGYIVLAFNNTFIGASILFPDGRVVHNRTDLAKPDVLPLADQSVFNDILFVRSLINREKSPISNFIPHMNIKEIGLFGHSVGGIGVVNVIRKDPHLFQAAISLDAPPTDPGKRSYASSQLAGFPSTPFMRLFAAEWRDLGGIVTPADAKFQLFNNNYYTLLSPNEENTTYTNHMSFSDLSTMQYQSALQLYIAYAAKGMLGTANGWDETKLLNSYVLQFFNMYLKQQPSPNLADCVSLSNDSMLSCGRRS